LNKNWNITEVFRRTGVIGHCKMTRQLIFILTLLTFVACQNSRTENQLTKLEKYIKETDSLTSNSNAFEQIIKIIQTKKPKFRQELVAFSKTDLSGLSREQTFSNDYDTTGNLKDRVLFSIRIKEFNSERKAAEAFLEIIEFQACCIPDEDFKKLKNFENLDNFKNSASTTILTENIMIEYIPANQTFVNEGNLTLVDEFLNDRKYLKLEIGHGGPAVWTRN
jgi:hypothetical protein